MGFRDRFGADEDKQMEKVEQVEGERFPPLARVRSGDVYQAELNKR